MKKAAPPLLHRVTEYGRIAARGGSSLVKGLFTARYGGAIAAGVPRARPVATDTALPKQVDVVVIGGGYIGCLTALSLAERGVRVAVCEKGVMAGEASGRSLGYVEGQFLDPCKMEIIGRSKELWERMNERVGGETGYRRTGLASLLANQESLEQAASWLESVRGARGMDAKLLGAREAGEIAVGATERYVGALYEASDGTAEPQLAVPAIAAAARRAGAIILQNCAVRGLQSSAGRISEVITEHGPIASSAVVLAGGAWSAVFLRSLGLDLPQFLVFSSIVRFGSAPGPAIPVIEGHRGLAIRPTIDGGYDVCKIRGTVPITPQIVAHLGRLGPALQGMGAQLVPVWNFSTFLSQWRIPKRWSLEERSPFEQNRVLMPARQGNLLKEIESDTARAFTALGAAPVLERWAGVLTSTIDNMPVISAVAERPGLYLGAAFYYGLSMGPAAGEALADLVMGRTPQLDLSLYRFSRFADGSPTILRP